MLALACLYSLLVLKYLTLLSKMPNGRRPRALSLAKTLTSFVSREKNMKNVHLSLRLLVQLVLMLLGLLLVSRG